MNVNWKFPKTSIVEVCGEGIERLPPFQKLIGKKLHVMAARWYQSIHYKDDAWTDDYFVEPIEFQNMETDEGVWIGGANLRAV